MVGAGGQPGGRGTTETDANVSRRARGPDESQAGKTKVLDMERVFRPRRWAVRHLPPLGVTCRPEVGTAATRERREPIRTARPAQAGGPPHCLCFVLTRPDPDQHVSADGCHLAHVSVTHTTKLEARSPASLRCRAIPPTYCLRHARGARSPRGTPPRPGPPPGG